MLVKVKDCNLSLNDLKGMMDKYSNESAIVSTKFNILQRVIMQCSDKSDDTLI